MQENKSYVNDTVDERKLRTTFPRTYMAGWHFVAE
jgi:hypothetical protein